MTPQELRDTLDRLEITQAGLAAYLNVSLRAVRNWRDGTFPVPTAVGLLLRALDTQTPPEPLTQAFRKTWTDQRLTGERVAKPRRARN
jgi:hypothetical protein